MMNHVWRVALGLRLILVPSLATAASPTPVLLAQAAKAIYQPQPELADYTLAAEDLWDRGGFRIAIFRHHSLPYTVIAVRGTANVRNWIFNALHIGSAGILNDVHQEISTIASEAEPWEEPLSPAELLAQAFSAEIDQDLFHDDVRTMSTFIRERLAASPFSGLDQTRWVRVCGHSMGGFLAQVFAVTLHVSGAAFNAPGLGMYNLDPDFVASRRGYDADPRVRFHSHRLEGDLISYINAAQGHLSGAVVSHRHGAWHDIARLAYRDPVSSVTEFHSIGRLHQHMAEASCSSIACSGVDSRSTSERSLAQVLPFFDYLWRSGSLDHVAQLRHAARETPR